MPKDKGSPSDREDHRLHPYKSISNHGKGHGALKQEWEDATCPICMDFPHNAVLLLCSSHDKGCRPYICNTGNRLSNCLNQFHKIRQDSQKSVERSETLPTGIQTTATEGDGTNMTIETVSVTLEIMVTSESRVTLSPGSVSSLEEPELGISSAFHGNSTSSIRMVGMDESASGINETLQVTPGRSETTMSAMDGIENHHVMGLGDCSVEEDEEEDKCIDEHVTSEWSKNLKCPLCRGGVNGWKVVDAARYHLNHKARSCSEETCSFSGTYNELREHAKSEHPFAHPAAVDPKRLRDWRHMEHQRNVGDVLSSIRATMPGVAIIGDHVLETGSENETNGANANGGVLLSVPAILFLHLFAPSAAGSWHLRRHQAGGSTAQQSEDAIIPESDTDSEDSSTVGHIEGQEPPQSPDRQ